jgi:hypothetical protein
MQMSQATMTQADKKEAEVFTMPRVSIGQTVLWYQGGNSNTKPYPVIVTEVGPRTINGAPVLGRQELTGIRHKDDPQAKEFEFREGGCWDHTQETKLLQLMLAPRTAVPQKAPENKEDSKK